MTAGSANAGFVRFQTDLTRQPNETRPCCVAADVCNNSPDAAERVAAGEIKVRCYFMRNGHIGAVELLTDESDAAAIAQAQTLFEERKHKYVGFEVWDRARFVHRFPPDGNFPPGGKKSGNEPKPAA